MSAWRDLVGAGAACAPDDQQGEASSSAAASRNPLGRLADSILGESRERNTFRPTPEQQWGTQEEALLFGDQRQASQQPLPYRQPPLFRSYVLPGQPAPHFAYPGTQPSAGFMSQSGGVGGSTDFVNDFLHEQHNSMYTARPNLVPQGPMNYASSRVRPSYDNASLFNWIPEYDSHFGSASQSAFSKNMKTDSSNEEEILEKAFASASRPTSSNWSSVQSLVKDYATSAFMHQGFQQDVGKEEITSSGLTAELDTLRKRSEEMARSYFPGASESFIQEQVNEFLQSLRENSDWVSSYHHVSRLFCLKAHSDEWIRSPIWIHRPIIHGTRNFQSCTWILR